METPADKLVAWIQSEIDNEDSPWENRIASAEILSRFLNKRLAPGHLGEARTQYNALKIWAQETAFNDRISVDLRLRVARIALEVETR